MSVPVNVKLPRFAAALARAAAKGLPVAPQSERDRRQAICRDCEHWRPAGNFGLGECAQCGCCKLKWWLMTEQCPLCLW